MTVAAIDKLLTREWRDWGYAWAMFTRCAGCGEMRMCRGRRRARMICVGCYARGKR